MEQMLSRVKGVDAAVAYAVGVPGRQIGVAAVTLRADAKPDALTATALRIGLGAGGMAGH